MDWRPAFLGDACPFAALAIASGTLGSLQAAVVVWLETKATIEWRPTLWLGALAAAAIFPADAAWRERPPPLPEPRPAELTPPRPERPEKAAETPIAPSAPSAAVVTPVGPTCLSNLLAAGPQAETVAPLATPIAGCGIASPVRLSSIAAAGDA